MLKRLLIAVAQVKAGKTSKNSLHEINILFLSSKKIIIIKTYITI